MNKILKVFLFVPAFFYIAFIGGTSFAVKGERYFTLVDDAMISMRYARNFAGGYGFVWNIGEPPVQGFTNLGWTLYMGLLHLLPFPVSKISLVVMLTSVLILLGNIFCTYKIAETLAPESKYAPVLAALITAFYFPLVFWSLRGMEVGLLVLLMNAALWFALSKNDSPLIGVFLALAIFVRIDAVIAAVLIVFYIFLKDRRGSILPAVAVILTTLAILYFQQIYFGDFLPATYYQKVTGYTLFERVRHGLLVFNEFAARDVLFLFFFSLAVVLFYKQYTREVFLLFGIFLAQCAYSIYVGGDYAEPETNAANRFITQGMPALIILFSWMTSRILADLETVRGFAFKVNPAIVIALMVLMVISGEPWTMYAIDNAPLLKSDIRRVRLALHVAQNTDPKAVIAVHAAGQIPYYSNRTTIDLLGLNDPIVAKGSGRGEFYPGHNKWNYEYSIDQLLPDVIADNFDPLAGYMHKDEKYQLLDSDIYVRKDSALVNMKGMSSKEYR